MIDIDLDELEPHLVGPHTPDLDRPISEVGRAAREEGYPVDISYALVGSCTNSSYEDIGRAAHVARQASAAGLRVKSPLLITPGSEQVRATIERDGLLDDLEAIGATVLAERVRPVHRAVAARRHRRRARRNTIVSSFNRNFPARNDGNAATLSFIGSPETVTAMALTGRLDVDFVREPVTAPDGTAGAARGAGGRRAARARASTPASRGSSRPPTTRSTVDVVVKPDSERLELLEPFPAWDGQRLRPACACSMKAVGKCTTDHISPAGPWLKYRGHLTNISGNLFIGVNNAFALDEPGTGVDVRDGSVDAAARSGQGLQGRRDRVGRDRRRELRRGLVA